MSKIHPTAIVASSASIADDVDIGPYCIIGPNVSLAKGCRLVSHVCIEGHTSVGERAMIYPFASLGTPPQSTHYRGGPTRLVIGSDCQIREQVTMNTGTEDGGAETIIGNNCFFMACSHVAHDCRLGNNVTFANYVAIGGHCEIGDYVVMGGYATAHQFVRIGTGAMISGMSGVRGDVIPYALVTGSVARLAGLNRVGMKRRGIGLESRGAVQKAYRQLFHTDDDKGEGDNFARRLDAVESEFGSDPVVAQIVAFIRRGPERGLCHPRRAHEE
jgi:UDP-N-acetylglucosamine acyltransferase